MNEANICKMFTTYSNPSLNFFTVVFEFNFYLVLAQTNKNKSNPNRSNTENKGTVRAE